ncbi:STAS domain-containing protein [Streptomyces sp. NPDC093225]|uniref:STAS domain-containing protein n=1 Tax=Streptomyces sp. NPDC093225 TaxID=3366034 RepID=UPI00382D22C0
MLPTLDVAVCARPERIVVRVAGELDFESGPYVTDVTAALPLDGPALAVDLSGVTYMDSAGLDVLLALRRRAAAEGHRLHLIGVPRQALRVLDLTGTRHLFTLHTAAERVPGTPCQVV